MTGQCDSVYNMLEWEREKNTQEDAVQSGLLGHKDKQGNNKKKKTQDKQVQGFKCTRSTEVFMTGR